MPLLGVSASGTIGDSVTFGRWRGVNYARQRVVPANPRTTAQQSQRTLVKFVVGAWQRLPVISQDAFIAAARNTHMTGYNLFTKRNLISLAGATNAFAVVVSPGMGGSIPLSGISATGGAGTIDVSATVGYLPSGYTLQRVVFVAWRDVDPQAGSIDRFWSGDDTTSPYAFQFTGLASGQYHVSAFTVSLDAKGNTLYGAPLTATVTVS